MKHAPKFTESSGNVLADLGVPNADEEMAKVDLAFEIRFLNALGRDVEIIVKPKPKSREAATLRVIRHTGRSRAGRATAP